MNYIVERQGKEQGIDVEPLLSGSINPYEPCPITIYKPGNWAISFENGDSYPIVVEDGYKFGGGKHKKSFIFDDCSWCFIVMHDRTYFYNRDTEESYVETISPDEISYVSPDFVLFKNNNSLEISLYDLNLQKPILTFADEVYHNTEVLVWKESTVDETEKELVIYSLVSRQEIQRLQYDEYCKKGNILYWVSTDQICSVLLNKDAETQVIIKVNGEFINFADSLIAISYYRKYGEKKLCLYNLEDGKVRGEIPVNGTLASVNGKTLVDVYNRCNTIDTFDFDEAGFPEAKITAEYEEYRFYPAEWAVFYTRQTRSFEKSASKRLLDRREIVFKSLHSEKCIELKAEGDCFVSNYRVIFYNSQESYVRGRNYSGSGYRNSGRIHRHNDTFILEDKGTISVLSQNGYWDNTQKAKYDFSKFEKYMVVKDDKWRIWGTTVSGNSIAYRTAPFEHAVIGDAAVTIDGKVIYDAKTINPFSEKIDAISEKAKWALNVSTEGILLMSYKDGKEDMSKILTDIYDSTAYQSVLLSETGDQIMYRDGDKTEVLDIRSGNSVCYDNLSYVKHVNGIRPLFRQYGSLQPRAINPVTGQHLDCKSLQQYQYISPDNKLYADSRLLEYVEYYNLIERCIISKEEYIKLKKKFRFPWDSKDKKNPEYQKILNARKKQINSFLESKGTPNFVKNEKAKERWIISTLEADVDYFIALFIEKRGIAIIRSMESDAEIARIKLGEPLTFINYVSFSPDSRYVSLAGYRNSSGGLFLIYDLKKGETLLHKDTNRAVWNTAFSKNGAVTAYTSNPITYFMPTIDQLGEDEINKMNGRNFLTFSPDGTVFALSNQGYISKYDRYGDVCASWGHQPSTLVEVRKSAYHESSIVSFNDLSDCGIAESSQRGNVASVSFSNDNSRLMMVGSDGVVIIRNLHLDDYAGE